MENFDDAKLLLQEQFIPTEFMSAEDRETLSNLGRSKTLNEILNSEPLAQIEQQGLLRSYKGE